MSDKNFKTEQESFWAGTFGREYIQRTKGDQKVASNLSLYSKIFSRTGRINSCIEFGASIGMNMQAIKLLMPGIHLDAIEINADAAAELAKVVGAEHVINQSILNLDEIDSYEMSLIKGVLIHINPDELPNVYEKLYQASSKYVLVIEYYNPSPVAIPYRGHSDRLFKRDFAGEMMDIYPDLKLIDYGFVYHRDNAFPQDDISWFLMEKIDR